MSILDPIDKQMAKMPVALAETKPIINKADLEPHEIQRIRGIISSIDYLTELISRYEKEYSVLEGLAIRRVSTVIISSKTPMLQSYYDDKNTSGVEVPSTARLLGEYSKSEEAIILYIYNIRAQGKGEWDKLFAGVYLHEMYHAYFRTDDYIPEIEEPMAELGALNELRALSGVLHLFEEDLCSYYQLIVKDNAMCIYNFGSYLYKILEKEEGDSYKIGPFLTTYKKVCNEMPYNCTALVEYKSAIRNRQYDVAFDMLCKLINFQTDKGIS